MLSNEFWSWRVMSLAGLAVLLVSLGGGYATAYAGEKSLLKSCSTSAAVGSEPLQALLAEASMASPQERNVLLEILRDKNNGCRKELEIRLRELKEKPSNFKSNTGRHAALTLGLMLDLPAASQLVEAEAASTGSPEWLSMLSQWDEQAYAGLLHRWVMTSAGRLRSRMGLPQATSELYGKSLIEERAQQGEKSVLTPLVFELYLKTTLSKTALSVDEFLALNIHYAAGNAGSRKIFEEYYSSLMKKNAVQWIAVFRQEQPWTQFQMIDLMGRVGGSEMIRELLWLSQNHADARMKSRASQALDAALKMR